MSEANVIVDSNLVRGAPDQDPVEMVLRSVGACWVSLMVISLVKMYRLIAYPGNTGAPGPRTRGAVEACVGQAAAMAPGVPEP